MTSQVIRYARLQVPFDLYAAQAEIQLLPQHWKDHLNANHYEGAWTVLALRSPGGDPDHTAADVMGKTTFADTPLLGRAPVLKAFLSSLPFPIQSVRLLRLAPGSHIKEHRDHELSFEMGEARLHIPIFTHPQVDFTIDGERVFMEEGQCWYINANLPHRVSNPSPVERIHLVIDCLVNDTLRAFFARSEKRYSRTENISNQVIEALRAQNMAASSRLADQMERREALTGWIPTQLLPQNGEWFCQWINTNGLPYTAPFFDETLTKIRGLSSNIHPYKSASAIASLVEWAEDLPHVPPTAFVFHVSRCGSTLVTQLLGLDPTHVTLSEVPFIDELLRAKDLPDVASAVKAALICYGQNRTGIEQRLFVKTDSWHLSFYRELREWFPGVPFILLYRSPDEVLYSQQKRRGLHAVPGFIEPELLGGAHGEVSLDEHMALVLEHYFTRLLAIARTEEHFLLVNYSEGIPLIVEKIAALTGTILDEHTREQMEVRSQFHAKYPEQAFSEERRGGPPPVFLEKAMHLYGELEEIRLSPV